MYERNIPGNIQRIKFQSACKHMQPSCPATRTGNQIKSRRLFFLTAVITSSTLRFLVLCMCNNDKFDNLSSPIVALGQFSTRRIALNERSLDAEDTWHCYQYCKNCINIRVQYKSWFVTLSVPSNVCCFCPSIIFQRVFHLATSSRNACLSPISVRKESKIESVF